MDTYTEYVDGVSSGYDMAIITLSPIGSNVALPIGAYMGTLGISKFQKPCSPYAFQENGWRITGYPGDKPSGTMWDTGPCDEWLYKCGTPKILRHQCDTYGGMSGSAIRDGEDQIIGVHYGGGRTVNFGVAIDIEHLAHIQWILEGGTSEASHVVKYPGSGDFESGSSTTICNPEDPNLGGPVQEGQKCYGPHTGCCANGLYCMIAETCERTYDSGGAFCCPSGTRPDNSNRCEPDSSCNFGPPSPNPPSPNPPSPPSPPTPGPTSPPSPPGSWREGCPGYWGGMSHDGGDAYDFIKTPESGNWACRPNNPIPRRIEQNSLDKFKSGGEFQTITVGSTYITVQKTFG
jgi:hypothetical protein